MRPTKMKVLLICLLAAFLYCVAQTRAQSSQAGTQEQSTQVSDNGSKSKQGSGTEGEKRFEAHCGRCHTPPVDLSPREARGVLMQMRVRAMISAEDERLILKYIAP